MQVAWIDFKGHAQQQDESGHPFICLPPASEALQSTYEGHRFLVSTTAGTDICNVVAEATPAVATIGASTAAA